MEEELTLGEIVDDLERVSRGEPSSIVAARKVEPDPEEEKLRRRWKGACDALYALYFQVPDEKRLARVERILNLR